MSAPTPTEHVIARKGDAGRVTVHGFRQVRWDAEYASITDCGLSPQWHLRNWLWVEYRTLNPDRTVLCKKCWRAS